MWSLTTPTFCMNAYTLVGPTKRYPCDFNCFANASACGVDLGSSATDRGARLGMIDVSCTSRSMSPAVIAATLASRSLECLPERVSLPEHDRPAQPDLEHTQGERLEQPARRRPRPRQQLGVVKELTE